LTVKSFDEIWQRTLDRKGSAEAIESHLPTVKSAEELAAIPDHRWLAQMTRSVFQAGFSWKVIEAKWEGFEEAFEGFEPQRWVLMRDQDLSRLIKDTRIVRHEKKILSVVANARLLCELADEHGSAAAAFARWPSTAYVELLELIKKRGSRLGGTSGQYFFRSMGKDSFVLSRDVCAALIDAGVVSKAPSSKRDLAAVQEAFNRWMEESGRPLSHLSRILALSIDAPATTRPPI
jgi:3-methyladenine DNA glycosylase Tag